MLTSLALVHALNQAQVANKEPRGIAYTDAAGSETFKIVR